MPRDDKNFRRSALLSFRFLGTAILGSVTMALVSVFGPLPAQIAVLGAFISILGGLFLSYLAQDEQREKQQAELLGQLSLPLALAADQDLYAQYVAISRSLTNLGRRSDPILREIALVKLASVASQVSDLAAGKVVFPVTEGWRKVYEQLLRSPELREYQSVAWVRSADYWQDQPGRQSMQANFEAVHRRVLVERIIILRDDIWPAGQLLPSASILPWIEEQHNHGLWVTLVRESELARESDLLCDIGIYGDRAVGVQELDERSRTLRFTLTFDAEAVRLAKEHWRRLSLYATPMRTLLDQIPPGA
jgi:hypothetical protein